MSTSLVAGTAQWGMAYGIANRSGQLPMTEYAAIRRCMDENGIRAIDTARAYGEAEAVVGKVLKGASGYRITTKVHLDCGPEVAPARVRELVQQSADESLLHLGGKHIDTVLLHRGAYRTLWGGAAWDELRRLRTEGVIGRIGVSAATPEEAWESLEDPAVEVLQVAASVLDQRLERAGFFREALSAGREVVVRSVFLQGAVFLDPDSLPANLLAAETALRRLRQLCCAGGLDLAEFCLRYIASLGPLAPIVGAESAAQLEENAVAWKKGQLPSEWVELVRQFPALPTEVLDPSKW